jgi:lipopolysaccharide biosynthesis glycosyltransferase
MWPLDVYIGWDSREQEAFRVAKDSLFKHTRGLVNIYPLQQSWLREQGHYRRPVDSLSSTEFSFTRFLVPHLQGFKGWALYFDCDFLWRGDVAELMDYADPQYAVMCVQHRYEPRETHKMDNRVQHQYPRKNWSSLMLFNCAHPTVVQNLTVDAVNNQTGMYLHQMDWAGKHVGGLPIAYNYLEGWHTHADCPNPVAVHFTRGGPWFKNYENVEYAAEWKRYV